MLQTAHPRVVPAACGCQKKKAPEHGPLYVVGALGFDFTTEARRDALFAQNGGAPIRTAADLAAFLAAFPASADQVLWTLSDDQHPTYVIRATGAYGKDAYKTLRDILVSAPDRVSVPGRLAGQARLMNGWVVPVIEPDVQGIRAWSTQAAASQIAATGGLLNVSPPMPVALPDEVNLTQLGGSDWAYWGFAGPASFIHSAQGGGQIGNFTPVGLPQSAYAGDPQYTFSWTNGDPGAITASGVTAAVQVTNVGDGFKLLAPADADSHTLTLYVAAQNAVGTLTAGLTSGTTKTSVQTSGNGPFLITLTYEATGAAQLEVEWKMTSVVGAGTPLLALQAATLSVSPSTASETAQDLQNFMDRIYFELRNNGRSPEERARNFAATQAYLVNNVITYAVGHRLNLQQMTVAHSPLCRPGSECWDVTLSFFDPKSPSTSALKLFRFTIDVSDVKPVMIGPMYKWNSY